MEWDCLLLAGVWLAWSRISWSQLIGERLISYQCKDAETFRASERGVWACDDGLVDMYHWKGLSTFAVQVQLSRAVSGTSQLSLRLELDESISAILGTARWTSYGRLGGLDSKIGVGADTAVTMTGTELRSGAAKGRGGPSSLS